MLKRFSKRITETIALAICLVMLLAVWAPVYGQAYLVEPGDSLWKISRHFGISIDSIQQENELSGDHIMAGQTLEIPPLSHVVKQGDTLYSLAQSHETTIKEIQEANNLRGSQIMIGQTLNIPVFVQAESPEIDSAATRMTVTDKEMDLLARAVYSEARGEPFQGQVAVAAVIINRVKHAEFPNTINGVIFEPWAFTAVHDGQFWLTPNQTAYSAVREALDGSDPSKGAIFYYNPVTATNQWIRTRPVILGIGKHVFAR